MTAKNFRVKNGLDIGDVENVIQLVGGVPTFTGTVSSEGSTQGNITIGITTDQTINTTTGDLVLNANSGAVDIQALDTYILNLAVNSIRAADSTAIDVNSPLYLTEELRVGGMSFFGNTITPVDSTDISFDGAKLQNVGTPTNPEDVANKNYVDTLVPTNINDLENIDASQTLDGDFLVAPITDSSTYTGFSISSQVTAGCRIPSGTTAQRPVIYEGLFRLNSETNKYEGSIDGNTVQEFLVSEIILNSDVDSAVELVDSFTAATYRAAEYMYTVENSGAGEYQTGKIMVVHDGTTAYHSEYGKVITGNNDLVTFTTGLSGGSVSLFASAQTPNCVFKAKRISMEVA